MCTYALAPTIVSRRLATVLVLLSGVLLAPLVWYLVSLGRPHPISWRRPMSLSTVAFLITGLNLQFKEWRVKTVWFRAFAAIAVLATVTMFVSSQLRGVAFAVFLGEMPVMAALRRRSLGKPLYDYPANIPRCSSVLADSYWWRGWSRKPPACCRQRIEILQFSPPQSSCGDIF